MYKQVQKILVFFFAISIGVLAVRFLWREADAVMFPAIRVSVESSIDLVPEFAEIEFDERTKQASMEMEFAGKEKVYRCTSNPAAEQRNWLVLMNRNGKFSLEERTVAYGKTSRSDFGSFSKLKFADSRSAVLMLTGQGIVRPGPVTTLQLKQSSIEDGTEMYVDGLEEGRVREFSLGEKHYRLRVTAATLKGGQSIYALVLERGDLIQIIWYKSTGYGEVIGDLEWVGDLDGDNKLDLLISSYAQNGGQLEGFLFLSSFAVENNLIGFAGFYSARCTA
jgi:hypothetical protein